MADPLPPTRDPATGEPVEPAATTPVYRAPMPGYVRAIMLIWFVAGLIDVLIGLRFVMRLLGASTASSFVSLIYAVTAPLVAPFQNVFPVSGQGTFVLEPASIVALIVYPLIALGLAALIRILNQRRVVGT